MVIFQTLALRPGAAYRVLATQATGYRGASIGVGFFDASGTEIDEVIYPLDSETTVPFYPPRSLSFAVPPTAATATLWV